MTTDKDHGIDGIPSEGWWLVKELERVSTTLDEMKGQMREDHSKLAADLSDVKSELAGLKVKSSFYGAMAGLGASIAIFAAQVFPGIGGR